MTTLVIMTPENGGWVMRRYAQFPGTGKTPILTHEAGVEDTMFRHTAMDFLNNPPAYTRAS